MAEETDLIDISDSIVETYEQEEQENAEMKANLPTSADDMKKLIDETKLIDEMMKNAIKNGMDEMQKLQDEFVQQGLCVTADVFKERMLHVSTYAQKSILYFSFLAMGETAKQDIINAEDTYVPTKAEILAWYEDYQLIPGDDDKNVEKMGKILYELTATFKAMIGGEKHEFGDFEPKMTTGIEIIQRFIIEMIVAEMVYSKAVVHKVDLGLPGDAFGNSGFDCWDVIYNRFFMRLQRSMDENEYKKVIKAFFIAMVEYNLFCDEYLGVNGMEMTESS